MIFKDRIHAANLLASMLRKYENKGGVVLAIPKGGVAIGYHLANELNFSLDIAIVKSISHPYNSENTIGIVSADGLVIVDEKIIPREYIKRESRRIQRLLSERYKYYRNDNPHVQLRGRTVIMTDDGMATGKSIVSIIRLIRKKRPKAIVLALPFAPPDTARKISEEADEFVYIYSPGNFDGVAESYEQFDEVSDEEVINLLHQANKKRYIRINNGENVPKNHTRLHRHITLN